jgi:hypothetical protein
VEVHVDVDQAPEPLHRRDRPSPPCADAALAGDPPLPCPDRAHGEVADPGGPSRVLLLGDVVTLHPVC